MEKLENRYRVNHMDLASIRKRCFNKKREKSFRTLKETMDFLYRLGSYTRLRDIDPYLLEINISFDRKDAFISPDWVDFKPYFCWTKQEGDQYFTIQKTAGKMTKKELFNI